MPRLEININKIKHNAKTLKEEFAKKGIDIEVGSEIQFDIKYPALLRLSTSPYVKKVFV